MFTPTLSVNDCALRAVSADAGTEPAYTQAMSVTTPTQHLCAKTRLSKALPRTTIARSLRCRPTRREPPAGRNVPKCAYEPRPCPINDTLAVLLECATTANEAAVDIASRPSSALRRAESITAVAVTAVLIAGDDGVPVRVREELASLGVPTVSICSSRDSMAARSAAAQGAEVVIGDPAFPETWEQAGCASAAAVGLLGDNDLFNLNAAMLVAELNPRTRIVVRMFSSDLASGIDQLLGGRGTVLSETEVAAPALVRAALSGNTGQRITLANHVLEVAEVDRNDPRLVVALCNVDTPTAVLPARSDLAEHVIGLVDPMAVVEGVRGALPSTVAQFHLNREDPRERYQRRRPPLRARLRAGLALIPRRAFILAGLIATVAAVATSVFVAADHLDPLDALYFTVTTMATVGYGDVNLLGAPDWLKIFDIGLMAVSAVLLASVLAFVTDILVSSRIDRALGRFPRPKRDHVIVCGLGKAGARVLAGLHELEIPCIGVEQHPEAVGIAVARQLEVPVVFGDARTPGTLEQLGINRARAVMAVTSDDLANIQCGSWRASSTRRRASSCGSSTSGWRSALTAAWTWTSRARCPRWPRPRSRRRCSISRSPNPCRCPTSPSVSWRPTSSRARPSRAGRSRRSPAAARSASSRSTAAGARATTSSSSRASPSRSWGRAAAAT